MIPEEFDQGKTIAVFLTILVVLLVGLFAIIVYQQGEDQRKLDEATEYYSCRLQHGPEGDC